MFMYIFQHQIVYAVRKSQDLGKSGQTMILGKVRNSQGNVFFGKSQDFRIFCNMKVDFGQKWINIYSSYSFQSFHFEKKIYIFFLR